MLDNLIEWALRRRYPKESWKQQPTNKKVFLETVLGGSRGTISERDLSPEEISYLQDKWKARVASALKTIEPYERGLRERIAADDIQTIKDKKLVPQARKEYEKSLNAIELARKGIYNEDWIHLNKGNFGYFGNQMLQKMGYPDQHKSKGYLANPNVYYEQYDTKPSFARREDAATTPDITMQTTLGKYRYYMNRQGKPVIVDNYDFNPLQSSITHQPTQPLPGYHERVYGNGEMATADPGGIPQRESGLYDLVRDWAGRKLPPGKGRPVYITLDN